MTELEKRELLEHIHEVSLLLKDLDISNEKYQDLILKQAKLALYLKQIKTKFDGGLV